MAGVRAPDRRSPAATSTSHSQTDRGSQRSRRPDVEIDVVDGDRLPEAFGDERTERQESSPQKVPTSGAEAIDGQDQRCCDQHEHDRSRHRRCVRDGTGSSEQSEDHRGDRERVGSNDEDVAPNSPNETAIAKPTPTARPERRSGSRSPTRPGVGGTQHRRRLPQVRSNRAQRGNDRPDHERDSDQGMGKRNQPG